VRRGEIFLSFSALNDGGNFSSGGGPSASASPYGMGGSMARFAITNSRLYTVGNADLDVFDISQPENPVNTANKYIGTNIETVYPFRDKLFIGSMNGMYIYNISNPDQPTQEGLFTHARTCDPVIADQNYAFVTLRSGNTCQGFTNQLDILNISNLSSPTLIKTYQLNNPHGLSKDGNILFICDGKEGLKIYNAANVNQLELLQHITGIETFDVIAWNGIALVVAKDGLYQYDYSNPSSLRLRSKIAVN
ncbi:MAG: LVIVD repeat-containing protein, partial [Chitinophagaceae bacterium]